MKLDISTGFKVWLGSVFIFLISIVLFPSLSADVLINPDGQVDTRIKFFLGVWIVFGLIMSFGFFRLLNSWWERVNRERGNLDAELDSMADVYEINDWEIEKLEEENAELKLRLKTMSKAEPKATVNEEKAVTGVPDSNDTNNHIIEAAIREEIDKWEGELTEADLEKVTCLHLGYKKLINVDALKPLTKLEELDLQHNRIRDVSSLKELTQLTYLDLINNRLTDVKGLEKLNKLEKLVLINNQLTDVKGLENLTQLKTMFLGVNSNITKAQIAELQKALPKCKIHSDFE